MKVHILLLDLPDDQGIVKGVYNKRSKAIEAMVTMASEDMARGGSWENVAVEEDAIFADNIANDKPEPWCWYVDSHKVI